jgi:hypothetical protein
MLKTGLEFAPGTTDDCKRLVGQMFPPTALLSAYRNARETFKTSDIVLVASDQSPDISGGTRLEYVKHLKQTFGMRASAFKMWRQSAHSVMRLPLEAEAMWLVVTVHGVALPVMCVIFATPYEIATAPEAS